MGQVHHTAVVNAPVAVAWAYVDDYQNATEWIFGAKKFTPKTEQTRGLGATFDLEMHLGPVKLHLDSEVVGYDEHKRIDLRTKKGLEAIAEFHLEPASAHTTRLTVQIDYTVPKGLAGKALDRVLKSFIPPGLRYTEGKLKQHIEERAAQAK